MLQGLLLGLLLGLEGELLGQQRLLLLVVGRQG